MKGSCRRLLVALGAANPAQLPSGLEPAIALGPDRGPACGEEVGRRDVADRAVEPDGVVVLHESGDDSTRLVERRRLAGADGIGLDGLVVALELAVRLRAVRRRPDVRHAGEPDELLEVLRDELR